MPQDFRLMNDKMIFSSYNGLFETDKKLNKIIPLINDTINSGNIFDFFIQGDSIIATGYNSRLEITNNLGKNWATLDLSFPVNIYGAKLSLKDNMFYLSYNNGYFFISSNYGKTFNKIDTTQGLGSSIVYTIYIDDAENVYLGTKLGIYWTKDKGKSWSKLNSAMLDFRIYSILKVDNIIFAGTEKKGLYKTTDNGVTWTQLDLTQINSEITINDIKQIKSKLYAGSSSEGIFVSPDLGETWVKKNNGYNDSSATVNIVNYGDYIFAGTTEYGAIYYSINEGENWESFNKGFSGYKLFKLRIVGDYLFAGTSTGLFRVNLKDWINGVDEIEVKNNFYTQHVFPNPAHDRVTAKIYWDLGLDIGTAKIGIYNIYGNQVESDENIEIIQESDWSGKLTWNCSGVPVGTYFIKIDYGTETKVIKFVKI